jgi:1-acyl-sn-glycerol-3-phosphate acyltransferase
MLFYRFEQQWFLPEDRQQWHKVNLIIFLNHTSLFEPLFLRLAPVSFLWRLSNDLVVPGADITMARPIIGKIYRTLIPGCIPITRKKDDSWDNFLSHVSNEKVNAILPEGRMKRRGGLDKTGQPMSVRGGVVDILQRLDKGKILFVYSGGLHHIQAPGDKFPRLFKTIKVNLEIIDLPSYKKQFSNNSVEFKKQVLIDISQRLSTRIPQ